MSPTHTPPSGRRRTAPECRLNLADAPLSVDGERHEADDLVAYHDDQHAVTGVGCTDIVEELRLLRKRHSTGTEPPRPVGIRRQESAGARSGRCAGEDVHWVRRPESEILTGDAQ